MRSGGPGIPSRRDGSGPAWTEADRWDGKQTAWMEAERAGTERPQDRSGPGAGKNLDKFYYSY